LNARLTDFFFPYSAQTIVEELTLKPWVFSRGRFREVKLARVWERVGFSRPVGAQWVVADTAQRGCDDSVDVSGKGFTRL